MKADDKLHRKADEEVKIVRAPEYCGNADIEITDGMAKETTNPTCWMTNTFLPLIPVECRYGKKA